MSLRSVALMALVAGCSQGTLPAPTPPKDPTVAAPLVLGETFQLDSKVLGERRVINVYLPPGYTETKTSYPVLYVPDGGMKEDFPHVVGGVDVSIKNEVIRPVIVVGIENTERRRDLTGPTTVDEEKQIAPHAGGSEAFRAFLRDELKPAIAARYRATAESAIIGESFAGLFVIETLLVEPALFDAYIAVDPSVWWNQQALVRGAAARFSAWTAPPRALFVATGDYQDTQDAIAALLAAVKTATPAGLTVKHVPMPDEQHHTIYPFAGLRGVRTMFALPR